MCPLSLLRGFTVSAARTTEHPRNRGRRPGGMAHLRKQVDMPDCIARISEPLLWPLLASSRHHRPPEPPRGTALRGEDVGLVRPYLVAFEQRQEERRTKTPRRTLWLAVHGVTIDPRGLDGVVSA